MSVDSREDGAEARIQLTEMPGGVERAGLRVRFGRLLAWMRRLREPTRAYRKEAWDGFRLGLPAALVLLALSAIIAHFKPLATLDAWMMGDIAARRSALEASLEIGPEMQLEQLEIAASARVAELEQKNVRVASEVARVGGVAPIDRAEMAKALRSVASGLAKTAAERKHPAIVAIDVDLAPLGQGATPPTAVEAMHGAITELRQYAHVIAVVLPRSEVASRLERNAFMTQAQCTRQIGRSASETPPYGLYFASARLFHRAGEPPLAFPYALKQCDDDDALPIFPSLGTLMHLRHGTQTGPSCGTPWDRLVRWLKDAPPPRQRTLTALCEQAHDAQGTGSDGMLLEDRFSEKKPADTLLEPYKQLMFNWRLLDSTQLGYTIVPTVQELETTVAFATTLPADKTGSDLHPKVLLLGIDGGARHDKFDIAGVSPEPVSGAALHGLQALSVGTVLSGSAWIGLAYDVAVGLLFAIFWALLSPLLARWRGAMPTLGGWVTALAPAGLAFLFIWGSMEAAAWLLEADLWLNPAYLILGLALDAYLEGWRQARRINESNKDPKAHPAQAGRWFLFGADIALNSLRRGYGARVHWVDIFLATGQGELLAAGAAHYEGSRGWEMADTVLSALLRVTVLVVGLSLVVHQLWKG